MNDVTEQVRETFETVATRRAGAPLRRGGVPRQGTTGAAPAGGHRRPSVRGAAAGVVAVALLAVPPLLDSDRGQAAPASPDSRRRPLQPDALPAPLYFSAGMRLMAATPDGEVHDLGRFESVVGSTAEGVLAVDTDSELVWIGATSSGEGDGVYTFERGAGPVTLAGDRSGAERGAVRATDGGSPGSTSRTWSRSTTSRPAARAERRGRPQRLRHVGLRPGRPGVRGRQAHALRRARTSRCRPGRTATAGCPTPPATWPRWRTGTT